MREAAVADEGCGHADEGEEMVGLAFIAAVEASAAGQGTVLSIDHLPVSAEQL